MTRNEAEAEANRLNKADDLLAVIVRILPADIDPIVEGDNGWDVEVSILNTTSLNKPLFGSYTVR